MCKSFIKLTPGHIGEFQEGVTPLDPPLFPLFPGSATETLGIAKAIDLFSL